MASLPTKRIPALPAITPPLTGNEQLECVQVGVSRKFTTRDLVLPTDSLLTVSGMGGSLPGSRKLTAGVGIQFTDGGPAGNLIIDIIGTGALPADPTATVKLTPTNGVAPTWMRSDSAPALDQTIAPTWTAQHIFTALVAANVGPIHLQSANPGILFNETDAAAANRLWDVVASSEQFRMRLKSDDGVTVLNFFTADRTGVTCDNITLRADAGTITMVSSSVTATFGASGVTAIAGITTTGQYLVTDANPSYYIQETDAPANEQLWRLNAVGGDLVWSTRTDANGGGATFMTVQRTGTTVDLIALAATSITLNGVAVSDYARLSQVNSFTAAGSNGTWPILMSSSQPGLMWNETDAAADNRVWRAFTLAEQLRFDISNDAFGVTTPFWTVDRTGTTVDNQTWTATQFLFTGRIDNPLTRQLRESFNSQTWAAGANTLDLSLGNLHRVTLNGNVTLSFSNPPPNSTLGSTFTIFLLQDGTGSRTVTWPASVHFSDGTTPVLTTTANRMDAITLTTFDGGTTYYGGQVLANMVP